MGTFASVDAIFENGQGLHEHGLVELERLLELDDIGVGPANSRHDVTRTNANFVRNRVN